MSVTPSVIPSVTDSRRAIARSAGLVGVLSCLLIASCVAGGRTTEASRSKSSSYAAETFFSTHILFGSNFSADEQRILMTSDESGVFNCYGVDAGTGEKEQLTTSTDNAVFGIGWFPRDDRFVFTSDQGASWPHAN